MSDKKPEKSPFAGLLADKLKSLDLELKESPAKDAQKDRPSRTKDRPSKASKSGSKHLRDDAPKRRSRRQYRLPNDTVPDDAEPLSDAELFEKSIQEMAPEDIYRGKFAGEGPKLPPASPTSEHAPQQSAQDSHKHAKMSEEDAQAAEDSAREAVGQAREMRLFEKTVGPVDPLVKRDKYRRPSMPDPGEDAARRTAYRSESPESLITPPLPKSGDGLNQVGPFDAAQRDLHARYKKRARQHEVAEINVRGDNVEDALRQVELFMHLQFKEKRRFTRIIHGRGLQSDGKPVLKPAILHWLEGPGFRYVRGYVPERNSSGDYGSLIVELERNHD